jgi:hypothetical protein
MTEKPEMIKFEKSILLNDDSYEFILKCTQLLFNCMKETNEIHKTRTEFLFLRLKYPEYHRAEKELKLEWACVKPKDDEDQK